MKKLLVLLAFMPLLFSCDLDGMIDDALKMSPTIPGFSFSKNSVALGDADAEKAFTAFIVGKSKFEGKKGDKVDCQVQLMGDKYGGDPDKMEIYYFQKGKLTYVSETSVTIAINGDYKAINGTWKLTREDDGNKILLENGDKKLDLKFWHETD